MKLFVAAGTPIGFIAYPVVAHAYKTLKQDGFDLTDVQEHGYFRRSAFRWNYAYHNRALALERIDYPEDKDKEPQPPRRRTITEIAFNPNK